MTCPHGRPRGAFCPSCFCWPSVALLTLACLSCSSGPELPRSFPQELSSPAACEQALGGYQTLLATVDEGLGMGCEDAPAEMAALCSLRPAIGGARQGMDKLDGGDCLAVSDAVSVADHLLSAARAAERLSEHLEALHASSDTTAMDGGVPPAPDRSSGGEAPLVGKPVDAAEDASAESVEPEPQGD